MKQVYFLALIFIMLVLFAPSTGQPQSNETIVARSWVKADSKAYARDKLSAWKDTQWSCLSKLWSKESAWEATAYNPIKVMGKNAGGIPQLLGLDPKLPATIQIDRGLDYIYHRYLTPCQAWSHFKRKGWY
jgi:hypothetical protein